MAKKSVIQQVPKVGQRVDASITDLVRTNLKGLLSNRQANTVIHNAFIDAYEEWEKTQKSVGIWKFTHAIQGLNRTKRNVEEWSMAQLARDLGVDVGIMRKIFDRRLDKGTNRLGIDDVVELALVFNVTPGYLLQPLREHLELDATYFFETIGSTGFKVKARDWLLWVHGLGRADGSNSRSMEENLMSLTPQVGLDISSKRAIYPEDELNRIAEAQYASPVSAMLEAQSHPVPGHLMSKPEVPIDHPMDKMVPASTALGRLHARTRAALAFMHHTRQALRLVEQEAHPDYVREDIEWVLSRMREDLSRISVNIEAEGGQKE